MNNKCFEYDTAKFLRIPENILGNSNIAIPVDFRHALPMLSEAQQY